MEEMSNQELGQPSVPEIEPTLQSVLPLVPLKDVILLPKSILPVIVGRELSINAVKKALTTDEKFLFITAQKDPATETPTLDDVYHYGTKATILQIMRMPNGSFKVLVEGLQRARVVKQLDDEKEFISVEYEDIVTDTTDHSVELEALWRHLKELYNDYAKLNSAAPANLMDMANTPDDMDNIADTLAVHIKHLAAEDRQDILQTADLCERIKLLSTLLAKEVEILQTENRIRGHIQNQVEKNQREYYLTEQIKAIQKELGREDQQAEIALLREKIQDIGLSAEALEKAEKELRRLEQMPPLSSEAVICRHYIDWIMSIPWDKESKDTLSITQAEKILNKNHAGLQKPKERIIEFLAAKKFSKTVQRAPIICLVGPPGVGKTSLGQSIAESLKREFIRISLGGVRDEAEIRGHRRTYIGALPGKIIQGMRKAKSVNPVILLDEIDKMSRDIHGDPASALLEVLDPEQNKSFSDHFLEVEYDLSKVMFIATANVFDSIPYPLLDRMEIIYLSGYTDDEKVSIARKFLIPKNLKEHGLNDKQLTISEKILRHVVAFYTKEAGVRQLERVMTKLMRKAIQQLLKKDKNKTAPKKIALTERIIKDWLGYQKYKPTSLDTQANRIGIATGLAWTEVGGDMLEIETTVLTGKGNMSLTGQLGEVMQESAQAALTYIRSRASEIGVPVSIASSKDIHIHLPEGATPKDGPSAGITMCAALISALTKIPLKKQLAMTGEITLRGRVIAVGGLKEKLLAAEQHGMTTVILPAEIKDEVDEIRTEAPMKKLELIFVDHMDQVLEHAFEKNPLKEKRTKRMKKRSTTKRASSASA